MIYEPVTTDCPIQQGDIFLGIPRVELSLSEMYEIQSKGPPTKIDWSSRFENGLANDPTAFAIAVRPVMAVVITQNCDAARAEDISLCEIKPLTEVYPTCKTTKDAKGWSSVLTQHARGNLKWFYLPPDTTYGFEDKLAVEFGTVIRCLREDLEELIHLRKCKLNGVANEHFREKLAEYFRRYPYDEWYPLSNDEFLAYKKKYPESKPFSWQKGHGN